MKSANKWYGVGNAFSDGLAGGGTQESEDLRKRITDEVIFYCKTDALPHFFGGFVRKCYCQNFLRGYAVFYQIHDSMRYGFSFSRARASHNKKRTFYMACRFFLFFVESCQVLRIFFYM